MHGLWVGQCWKIEFQIGLLGLSTDVCKIHGQCEAVASAAALLRENDPVRAAKALNHAAPLTATQTKLKVSRIRVRECKRLGLDQVSGLQSQSGLFAWKRRTEAAQVHLMVKEHIRLLDRDARWQFQAMNFNRVCSAWAFCNLWSSTASWKLSSGA